MCFAPLALIPEETERANLVECRDDRRVLAAVPYPLQKLLERRHFRERIASVGGLARGEMEEADPVLELERRVPEPAGLGPVELGVDGANELLVLRHPIGLQLVTDHDALHRTPPCSILPTV